MAEPIRKTLSTNAQTLEKTLLVSFGNGIPAEHEILALANQFRPIFPVSDEEFTLVIRHLHQSLAIDMKVGSCVTKDHLPWIKARKSGIDPYYWQRYETDLRKQGWPSKVVSVLDEVTDEILDRMGDPTNDSDWSRRGLVIGDVQSGKTSNYTGLICKAADAGYKLIILLTGTLESLRRQTQARLDAGFVGQDSSGLLTRKRNAREIGVGLVARNRSAGVFTSTTSDFRASTVNQLGFKLKDYKEPVLLVLKKNKRIIENLTDWLINSNANNQGKIDLPLLLIDDEADNASVNTNLQKATAINAGIRNLLEVFPKSSYVGFTATPFANVFINPETEDEMIGDDLFPRDFIYALDAPSNYIGASLIFGDNSPLHCLRHISDAATIFPKGQKSDSLISDIPASMEAAIRCFVVVNAIMDVRGDAPLHRSMLINVSHYTQIQDQVRSLVDQYLRQIQRDIKNYASLNEVDALQISSIKALNETFQSEYTGAGVTWSEVQAALTGAALPVEVRSVNQKSGAASLDYVPYKQNGLRVIAVGGNSLARGLTLEGLVVSYFYRGTQMYDALLQMGRWFGYRPGYQDLFRIWMHKDTMRWYEHITEAADELRAEVKYMQKAGLTPNHFGMRVRSHPESLLITARNKMRHSEEIMGTMAVNAEMVESYRLLNGENEALGNFRAAQRFIGEVMKAGHVIETQPEYQKKYPLWRGVPKDLIVNFLHNFVSNPLNPGFEPRALIKFLESDNDPKLDLWDIAIPNGSCDEQVFVADSASELKVKPRERKIKVEPAKRSILINEEKMRVGSPDDLTAGLSIAEAATAKDQFIAENPGKKTIPAKAYCIARPRPLLLLHLIKGTIDGVNYILPDGCDVLVAIGLAFPQLSPDRKPVKYRINLVEIRNLLAADEDGIIEGTEDDEDDDAE